MNLGEIREKIRILSGRFDLVNSDGTDNGADFFINEGRKYLDRLNETQQSAASHYAILSESEFFVTVPYCRAIKEIWAADINGRWQLEKMNLQDLMAQYLVKFPSERSTGRILYYAPCINRTAPADIMAGADDLSAFAGFMEQSSSGVGYNSILFNCPVEKQTMIDVRGNFYSEELINDSDENFWSIHHPFILCMGAMRAIEISHRNTQGVNDWTKAIMTELQQLEMDYVDEMISEVDQMKG